MKCTVQVDIIVDMKCHVVMQVSAAQTDYAVHGHGKCHYPNQHVPQVRAALFWFHFVFCFFNIKIYVVFVKISLALKMCLITTFFLLVINNASVSQQSVFGSFSN